jgi:pentatricopeptide repeat protein
MQGEGLSPDAISFICILKACGKVQDLEKGSEIHDEIVRRKLLDDNIELGNALVAMYVKCRVLTRARLVLEELVLRNTISWNVLISGYTQQGQSHEALNCLEQMQSEGIAPDAVTFICTMKACGKTGAIDRGKQIHTEIISRGLLKKDVELGNALVDMYCKCGKLEKAQEVLKELPVRDIVSWNTLIAGFVCQGQSCEAMNCFKQMQNDGLSPDAVTILCILKACSSSGAVSEGKLIHDEFINKDLLESNAAIGAALVDMYAKCGMLDKAQELLEELPIRNMVLWSVLIARYAEEKRGYEALQCFEQMQSEGFAPDRVTLLSVLHACSSSGLLDEAQTLFGNMKKIYGLSPNADHHTCMVVMLGSIGNFEKAMEVIKAMPSLDFIDIWLALLGACEKWGNVKLGILAFDQVIQIDRACAGAYVLMASIFGATGMQKDAEMVEAMRVKYVDWEANG